MRPVITILFCLVIVGPVAGQSLRGSKEKVATAYNEALTLGLLFVSKIDDVGMLIDAGHLITLEENESYEIDKFVLLPVVLPETKLFIERCSRQYKKACGEKLVVTGALRPDVIRLWNSSPLSVHATGMAIDLRLSESRECRVWLEETLLFLNRKRVILATREKNPPHYHVVVFPDRYSMYVASKERLKQH